MLFSIITPVYNSHRLMDRYFQSLLAQTFNDFEIILIDDCSTDNSYEELKKIKNDIKLNIQLAKTHKNLGPGNARNIGMLLAKGEWITFIDNDDWVSPELLQSIYSIVKNSEVNCVVYDYYMEKNSGKRSKCDSIPTAKEGLIDMPTGVEFVTNHSIGKFYKLNIIMKNGIQFPLTRRCEDVAFTIIAIVACKQVYYLKRPMYFYYQRPDSLSNNIKLDENDMVVAFNILRNSLEKVYPNEIASKSVKDLLYGCILIMCKSKKSSSVIKQHIDWYESLYPQWESCKIVNTLPIQKRIFLKCIKYKAVPFLRVLAYIHSKLVAELPPFPFASFKSITTKFGSSD